MNHRDTEAQRKNTRKCDREKKDEEFHPTLIPKSPHLFFSVSLCLCGSFFFQI